VSNLNKRFALITKDYVEIKEKYQEIDFLHAVLGSDFSLHRCIFDEIKTHLNFALNTIAPREANVISSLYGLNGNQRMDIDEIAESLNASKEQVEAIIEKSLRKLRHPSRSKILTKNEKPYFNKTYYKNIEYIKNIEFIILKEIEEVISANFKRETVYLSEIMNRYDIELEKCEDFDSDIAIEDLELSVRAYNCLKRASINTLGELKEALDNGTSIRNLGEKSKEELIDILNNHNYDDGHKTIAFIKNGQKTIYKYYYEDESKIAKSIFRELLNSLQGYCNLLKSSFSPGLIDILLMRGYLFEEDVIAESEKMISEFKAFGLEKYALEIEQLSSYYNFAEDYEKVYIVFDEKIINLILNKNIKTFIEFKDIVEQENDVDMIEDLKMIAQCLFQKEKSQLEAVH